MGEGEDPSEGGTSRSFSPLERTSGGASGGSSSGATSEGSTSSPGPRSLNASRRPVFSATTHPVPSPRGTPTTQTGSPPSSTSTGRVRGRSPKPGATLLPEASPYV
ncbi:hypothetical protein GBA65_00545 [Rubrobacter marinus]|uniref:Uncharacterized protein n=1 Tax=Rubrobacter marinus TaxID=2653852 RepID=A0A6G8PT44_9ACTN|nr:hypothetical protein [Rubrobacter marinus]QIN77252.1 hypothetical protein GBA65_00545 [Rubrobacter marinus]